ncbi:right-handed parallel beta-helix repeat-containing protein [Herbidospora daliensis]|uniref:right-handed parallel beta-helix repeat-containing protein n=1 Tax=Herbidospora daliensis TaxID=295585 RepID=UPI000A04BEC0|nr:right-handed parallel beta-helix repeat-containing protein [Herbidospora daliensis]
MKNTGHRILAVVVSVGVVATGSAIGSLAFSAPAAAARVTATCANGSGDAAIIQAAINGSAAGDEIVVDGPCSITTTITLLGGRAYRGDSAHTLLKQANGRNLAAVLASDSWVNNDSFTGEPITLRDLTVDANAANNPTAGDAVVIRSWRTAIRDLTIRNAKVNGLRVTNTSQNGTTLTNSQVNGSIQGLFVEDSGQHGVYVQDSGNSVTDWNLSDSWIASSGGDAVKLENSAGWTVERNHVYGVGGTGINAGRLFASSISDNYVEDFGVNGIGVTVQGDAASTVVGNRVFQFNGAGTTYLTIKQVNYGTGNVAVTGNAVRGNGSGTGLSYQRGGNQLTVTSTGNSVTNVTTQRSVGAGVTLSSGL